MSPKIALAFCTIFVLFLLSLDRKQFPEASLALWMPSIWFLMATSKPLGAWFGIGIGGEQGSVIDRSVLIMLFVLGLLVVVKRKINIIDVLKQNSSVILLLGFMLISILWSDIAFVSFKRWTRNIIVIYMGLIIASEDDPRQALQCIFRRMIYVHIPFSFILIRYFSHLGRAYGRWSGELMWIGVSSQKNGLAFLCTLSLFYFAWTFMRRLQDRDKPVVWYQKYIEILIVFLSLYLFMGPNRTFTYSATALVVLIIGISSLAGFFLLKKFNIRVGANILTIFIAAIILYGTALPFIGHLTLFDPSQALGRDSTLTDRATVWGNLLPFAIQKPILGHGFGGFWTDAKRASYYFPAHNGYLETILDTGLIGLIFLSIFLISNCRKAQSLMSRDLDWGALWFCFLLMAVTRNMTESVVTSLSEAIPAVLLFLLISLGSETIRTVGNGSMESSR